VASKDFYAVLGVSDKADEDEIKKAYRNLAKQYHPDANPNNPKASERFKEISEAQSVLSDTEKRAKYDRMRRLGAFDPRRNSPAGTGARGQAEQMGQDFDFGGVGSFGLGDIFSSIFGKREEEASPGQPEHVEITIKVPFRTAANGGKVPVKLDMNDLCPGCGGTGGAAGASFDECGECKGRGTVSFGQGGFAVNRPCPACRGKGETPSKQCPTCTGSGENRSRKEVLVTIPPATESGTKVRLKGQGPKIRAGGKSSDVLITFEVSKDRFFHRDGLDITCEVPVSLGKAVLGSTLQVKTIRGSKVRLKIPAGTQPGSKFRIRGQGLTKGGQKGDQIVALRVKIPKKMTKEQEAAFREFVGS
jgi:molecular chaperone DnaJ